MDPHTAVGVAAARALHPDAGHAVVCLATAHPAKFGEIVDKCLRGAVDVVREFAPARALVESCAETRCAEVGNTAEDVKAVIERVLAKDIK